MIELIHSENIEYLSSKVEFEENKVKHINIKLDFSI
jgi:hypothetical protein